MLVEWGQSPQPLLDPEPLLYWAKEREALRRRKEAGEPLPWTEDPVLQRYRFCNVRRQDDRVSRWLRANVLPFWGIPTPDGLKFTALCRYVNWPPTLRDLMQQTWFGTPLDWPQIGQFLDYRCHFEKTWTGAYMVRAERKALGQSKGTLVAEVAVHRELSKAMPELMAAIATKRRQEVHRVLSGCYSWGSFMAGQVVDDWGWTPILEDAVDVYEWAPIGPGSRRGLNRLLGRPLSKAFGEQEFCAHVRQLRTNLIEALGSEYVSLTLMDVQNCLCETDKWLRARLNEGRPRTVYKPEEAY